MVGAEHLRRHAVRAAKVAAIGHRDAQITQGPGILVAQVGHWEKDISAKPRKRKAAKLKANMRRARGKDGISPMTGTDSWLKYPVMLSVAEAEKQVLEAVAPLPTEDCPLVRAARSRAAPNTRGGSRAATI